LARDDTEFVDFVQSSASSLRRLAYLMCGDWHRAEDAVQQAYVRLYVAWPRLRRTDSFGAYAYRTLLSVVRDDARRSWFRRERSVQNLPERAERDPNAGIDARMALAPLLQQVPERQRAVLVLRYLQDMSVDQTADVLRIEPGTVKSQAARGLTTLRRLLVENGVAAADAPSSEEAR
jgi:RNA polymerase sigma-70 factor (sigma-E family)